jgi:hypothetical protein
MDGQTPAGLYLTGVTVTKLGRERLKYLAMEVLPYVSDEEFEQDKWYVRKHGTTECLSEACALGHLAASKRGKTDGWGLYFSGDAALPTFGGRTTLTAAKKYFEVDDEGSPEEADCLNDLFIGSDEGHTTAIEVQQNILGFLRAFE